LPTISFKIGSDDIVSFYFDLAIGVDHPLYPFCASPEILGYFAVRLLAVNVQFPNLFF